MAVEVLLLVMGKGLQPAMADIEKLIGRATLAIPIVHIAICGLYIVGYSAGFGGNIGGMFSASDFFTITIQHLVTTYVLSFVMPVAIVLLRHRSGRTYAADLIEKEECSDTKERMIANRDWVVSFMSWILPSFGLIIIALFVCAIWTGSRLSYYVTLNPITLALTPTWWRVANFYRFYGLPAEMTWCGIIFVLSVLGIGLDAGEKDRRYPYNYISIGHMRCKNQVVLSPIGDRFISVTPDDRRHIIDDQCKTQFDFAPADKIPDGSLYTLVKAKLVPPASK